MQMKSTASEGFSLRLVTVDGAAPGLVNYQILSALESTVAVTDELVRAPLIYVAATSREIKVPQGRSKSSQNRPVYT